MSESRTIKNPSPLVLSVLALDEHFSELSRLSARIDEMDLKSSFDFDQTERLINHFAEAGQSISGIMQNFVVVLNEARDKAEAAAQLVSVKAEQLKERKDLIQQKMSQFQTLSQKVSQLNESLLTFKRPEGETLSADEKNQLAARLSEIETQLQALIQEAQVLKDVGQEAKIKVLEQNADSMRQALIAVSQKISAIH